MHIDTLSMNPKNITIQAIPRTLKTLMTSLRAPKNSKSHVLIPPVDFCWKTSWELREYTQPESLIWNSFQLPQQRKPNACAVCSVHALEILLNLWQILDYESYTHFSTLNMKTFSCGTKNAYANGATVQHG
jgi:hypothetical protein